MTMEKVKNWYVGLKSKDVRQTDELETEKEYKERWHSIYIIYFTMFMISLGFGIILTGVWPYLDKLDPSAGKEFMGYIVAANPLAQMLLSPLAGWWSNKLGSIRLPMLLCLAIFTLASVMYSSLEFIPSNRKYWMLFSRLLVGFSSASIAPCRSYVSAATKVCERTKAVSMISLAQVLGFIVGPALQASVVYLGDDGTWVIPNLVKLNMYTACGWINVLLSLTNFCLFLPYFFREHKIAAKEAMQKQGVASEKDTYKKVDQLSAWTLIIAFFVLVFNFMLLETLGTSLTMDQFAWTKDEALYYIGLLMTVGGIISIICFLMINPLSKWFPEEKVMIWGGFLFMVLGRVTHIPWGDSPPIVYDEDLRLNLTRICDTFGRNNLTNAIVNANQTQSVFNNLTAEMFPNVQLSLAEQCKNLTQMVGCPSSQEWCSYTKSMTHFQFYFGFILTCFGYPIGVTLIQTIFSKILGPRPQGVWMGLLTGSGCFSRVMGPVFVTYIYTEFGTNWTFGFTTVMMILSMVWLLFVSERLKPLKDELRKTTTEEVELNRFVNISLPKLNE